MLINYFKYLYQKNYFYTKLNNFFYNKINNIPKYYVVEENYAKYFYKKSLTYFMMIMMYLFLTIVCLIFWGFSFM